ncbi:MAG: ArsJ-associated glyceraldehyde-3-phosphate dehydrogenase [Proteobacteria bacterium]|nr:ArsJ-associated glyceraldehyde-3-phosphate dehydrogenase [Pseudomonadota bacterium]
MRVGINGFGRMGRLALRAGWDAAELEFVALNEPSSADAQTLALLLEFDSVQGRWNRACRADREAVEVAGRSLRRTAHEDPREIPWKDLGVELVLECSGRFRTRERLLPHFEAGVERVVVSAPVKHGVPNIVLGVNDDRYDLSLEPIVTAASCTTNCLAPLVRVIHDGLGIERGAVTTLHAPTNTQTVHDAPRADPRRARAAGLSLIPTSTNSATAVTLIVPELAGKLDSIAVRVPTLNASLTDCAFQVARPTDVEEVNGLLREAAEGALDGILGYEIRPLVGADFARDPRSGVVDALSTRVVDGRMVKLLAWYDNEWGYANRLVELTTRVAGAARA